MNQRLHKIFNFILTLLLLSCFSLARAELPPETAGKPLPSLSPMLKNVMPAVVNIYVQGQLPPGRYSDNASPQDNSKFQDIGSGVIVDSNQGYVLTNAHVVRDAQTIVVTLNDGRRLRGQLIGVDNASDIAVIKINPDHLSIISFADSDKVQVGDFVVAIGSPFGVLTQTVTSGVVSALNRSDLGIEGYENFIQTDAPINPGNSGGALVNLQGQLIGINTAILAPSGGSVGIGFAIPSNMAKNVMEQLIKYGKVERGYLGVLVQDLTPDLANALNAPGIKGAIITQVNPGSPAAKAGLQPKDIVTKINGQAIENAAQLRNAVGLVRVGTTLSIEVLRDKKTFTINAATAPAQRALAAADSHSLLDGVRLRNYDELSMDAKQIKGIQVVDLDVNSPAALKGLRPGDVILEANGQAINSITQLLQIANSSPKRLLLEVERSGADIFFMVIDNN